MTSRWMLLLLLAICSASFRGTQAAERPNILWIIVDDMSANFSCYGETLVTTPHVDRLAREGVQFNNAFVTTSRTPAPPILVG